MKPIKFRAYFQTSEEKQQKYSGMYDVKGIDFESGIVFVKRASVFAQDHFDLDEVELIQFTGLLDQNDKEIFEGDVVIYPWDKNLNLNMKVVWLKHGWYITDETAYLRPTQWRETVAKIIGNIYENPELI